MCVAVLQSMANNGFVNEEFGACLCIDQCSTDMRRLKTAIRSEKCAVRRFRRCANVIQYTYANPDSTV